LHVAVEIESLSCKHSVDMVGTPVYTSVMAATHKTRTVVYFDPAERETLEKLSAKTGAPVGELVRRAVAEWLKKTRKGGK
jgi:hypothetical protein